MGVLDKTVEIILFVVVDVLCLLVAATLTVCTITSTVIDVRLFFVTQSCTGAVPAGNHRRANDFARNCDI